MTEQARESLISLTESVLNDAIVDELSFADDGLFNDSVFESKMEMSTDVSADMDVSMLDITDSVSDQVGAVEEDSTVEADEALTKAYNTSNKRFERAIGNRVINNDIIKLNPVSLFYVCIKYET